MKDKKLRKYLGVSSAKNWLKERLFMAWEEDKGELQSIKNRLVKTISQDEISRCSVCGYLVYSQDAIEAKKIVPIKKEENYGQSKHRQISDVETSLVCEQCYKKTQESK
jgi:hypothetical protein